MKARLTRRAKIDSAEKNGQKQLLVIARCIFQIFALNHISYYTMKDSSHLKSCQSNCFFLWGCRHKDWGRVIYTNSAITILRWWFICCSQYSQSPSQMKCEIFFYRNIWTCVETCRQSGKMKLWLPTLTTFPKILRLNFSWKMGSFRCQEHSSPFVLCDTHM